MAVIGWLSEVPLGYILVGISACDNTAPIPPVHHQPPIPNGSLLAKLSSVMTL